ncbi:hypothetical protein [Bacillus alkalicola]|uniref:Phage-related protein n=1 Tax=Evansella alkalicola TaxID=745819 RepID=A0ABS6JZU6_9BACI|nr:hypothetical protein [Bacillus alkalicola]MBU9724121.1 hypothetical protein [Bacillus alkalicola]
MITIEIFKLFGSILVDDDEANKSISRTEKNTKSMGERLKGGIKTAAKWGAGLAAGAGVAVGAMIGLASRVGNTADELLDLQSITGMSTDSLQEWRKVTEVAGVSTDAVASASEKLTKSLTGMQSETHKGRVAMESLGYSLEDIENMNADERMDALTVALSEIEDETERAKVGTDLFGGSWSDIAPVVDMGAEAMQNAKDSANIISEDDLNKANEFRISMDNMKDRVNFFFMELGIKLLPMLQTFFDWIEGHMPKIEEISKMVFDGIGIAINFVIEWIGRLIGWLREWFTNSQETIHGIKDGFMDFVEGVKVAFETAVEWIKFIIEWVKQWYSDNEEMIQAIIAGFQEFVGVVADLISGFVILLKNIISGFITLIVKWWGIFGDDLINVGKKAWQFIVNVFKGAFDLIRDLFNVFARLFRGDWSGTWEAIQNLIRNYTANMQNIIKSAFDLILTYIMIPINKAREFVVKRFENLLTYFGGLKSKFTGKVRGLFDGVKDAFRGAINWIIKKWNDFQIRLGGQEVSLPFGQSFSIPSITIDTPNIPMLAKGGNITRAGSVLVGEEGPEFLDLPKGARVTPLDRAGDLSDGGNHYHFAQGSIVLDVSKMQKIGDVVELMETLQQTVRKG